MDVESEGPSNVDFASSHQAQQFILSSVKMASSSTASASGSGGVNDRDVAIEANNFIKELEVSSHRLPPPSLLSSHALTLTLPRCLYIGRAHHQSLQAQVRPNSSLSCSV